VLRGKVDHSADQQPLFLIIAVNLDVIARLREGREIPLAPVLTSIIRRRGCRWQDREIDPEHLRPPLSLIVDASKCVRKVQRAWTSAM